jgi:hypothetical protein
VSNLEVNQARFAEGLAHLEEEMVNTSEFDTLITEEIDELRKALVKVNASRTPLDQLLATPPRKASEHQGNGVVTVAIIGMRDRDSAVVNARLKNLPGTDNLDLRFIPSTRSPFELSVDYTLVRPRRR